MASSKALAVAFYLGAVVIGAAAGIAADRTMVRDRMENRRQDQRAMRERFFSDLSFTPAQRSAWDSLYVEARRADSVVMAPPRALQRSLRPQIDSIWKAWEDKRRLLLTPEQQKLFDERQARRQKQNNDRR